MKPALKAFSYDFDGHSEYVAAIEPADAARRILIITPLFDEMNRTRRVLVSAMRTLAERGVAGFLPDLPGTNESEAALVDQDISRWRKAVQAASEQLKITHIASVRGGALVDGAMPEAPHWRLAPVKGALLLKTMLRTRVAGDKEAGIATTSEVLIAQAVDRPILLGGNWLSPSMIVQLNEAEPDPLSHLRTVSIGDGDDALVGSPLWLRAEPQDDPVMARAIADDLDRWSASCGG